MRPLTSPLSAARFDSRDYHITRRFWVVLYAMLLLIIRIAARFLSEHSRP